MSSRPARSRSPVTPITCAATRRPGAPTWGTDVERFVETVIDGIATGSIYGALALALALIYRATGIVNFAQGEMAMFSTFIAWGLTKPRIAIGLPLLTPLVPPPLGGMVI